MLCRARGDAPQEWAVHGRAVQVSFEEGGGFQWEGEQRDSWLAEELKSGGR